MPFLYSPLEQFKVNRILNLDLVILDMSISNAVFSLGFFLLFTGFISFILKKPEPLLKINWVFLLLHLYKLVLSLVVENSGKSGLKFFPFLHSLFFLILSLNILGLVPYSFTITAHMSFTFFLSFSIWLGTVFIGLYLHRVNFFSMFLPKNSPLLLALPLIGIELSSYLVRPLSLGVRLAANLTAGHLLLNLGASFLYFLVNSSFFILSFLPFILLVVFSFLELAVAFIQAYVFTLLTVLYINDSLELH